MDISKLLKKIDGFKIITSPAIIIVFILFALMVGFYLYNALPAIEKYGLNLFIQNIWQAAEEPAKEVYGLAAPIWGSIYTATIAILIALPLSIGYAIFVNDYAPKPLKYPLIIISDIMAGLPTIIYGIWGAFILVPLLRDHVMKFLYEHFSFIPLFDYPPLSGYCYLSAGILLGIMVVPFASAIIREAYAMIPSVYREGLVALGATRYETTKVLIRFIKPAIISGFILAFGRALGETVAVSLVIGNSFNLTYKLFAPGYTISSLIANQFGNAILYEYMTSVLYSAGLVLFVIGLIVNIIGLYYLKRWRENVSH
ncbi:putative phosphate transport system permease protein PstC [Methanocaldococcus lauensis]|uniref:phosphate ABC transporter permease subunit PstC n=1 Tax=Methanocaldococcus sp. TaxID=2152917 RepID=UPI001BF036E2|nr:phosphate ABC transporter permease subunit PstC [Methanocaldococcus sp.]MCQ6254027.1 phosphate ABC transporter permease subunit PstC [Methanocaldococcus sp.]CAB3289757.1 putative phosphate transport system permease protein PstC [Methanocaldococcus lauensis]